MSCNRGNGRKLRTVASQLTTAACVAAALCLAGCDSKSSVANKAAQKKADEAARLTSSAGELRPTQKFMDDLKSNPTDILSKGKAAAGKITADAENKEKVWTTYLEQRTVADDLSEGMKRLNDALKTPDLTDPAVKWALQTQVGATSTQQAEGKMGDAERKMTDLVDRLLDVQNSADYLGGLGMEAGVLEKRAKSSGAAEAAKSKVAEAKAAVGQREQQVADLEKQIADKKARAGQVYAETDAAFQAADRVAGKAAIEDGKKAVEARREADNLTAEVLNLQPQLNQAKMEREVAKIQLSEAEADEAAVSAGVSRSTAAVESATKQAKDLRSTVQTLKGSEGGLDAKYKELTSLANDVQKEADAALVLAQSGDKAYGAALTQLRDYQKKIDELKLESTEPLAKVAKTPENRQLLQLGQAAAQVETARAYMLQYLAEHYKGMGAAAMAKANAAAGLPAEAAPATAAEEGLKAKALTAFDTAIASATAVFNSAPDAQRYDVTENGVKKSYFTGSTLRWLSLTLKAVAQHGRFVVSAEPKDLEVAVATAEEAKKLNPFLMLNLSAESSSK